ncbi:MAG: glutamate racemase [Chitinophagaceae bacterium]
MSFLRYTFLGILLICFESTIFAQQKTKNISPIGVFDSGTGGLTVLEAMLTLDAFNNKTGQPGADGKPDFQSEYFQYLADQANMPYGNYAGEKKTKLLQEHVIKNMDFLLKNKFDQQASQAEAKKEGVKMLVLACNTATAYALNEVKEFSKKQTNSVPVVGVINAGVKAALAYQSSHEKGTIGVFATAGTVASDGYPKTILAMAKQLNMPAPSIVSQGGYGLADAIDRDYSFFAENATAYRSDYKGPSMKNGTYPIDTSLLNIYNFNKLNNKLLCEFDDTGKCLDIQLNDPENYVRYHLVSLLEKMKKEKYAVPMNTLILGCTHYPFMRDTIRNVLNELYQLKQNGSYLYRSVLAEHVELIDPSVETAKEAYVELRKLQLVNESPKMKNNFFITVPNKSLTEVKLQSDGWFTYEYKYGRVENQNKKYVNFVPFDQNNISSATYERIKVALPNVYQQIILSKQ